MKNDFEDIGSRMLGDIQWMLQHYNKDVLTLLEEKRQLIEALKNVAFNLPDHHPMQVYINDFLKGGETNGIQ